MIVRAYAKINLSLRVLDKRDDGYHNIESVMQTISLHDTLKVELIDKPGEINLEVRMLKNSNTTVPTDESNICYKAAQRFLVACDLKYGVSIRLDKLIPSQAGLGGGSSDAASVLLALNKKLHNFLDKKTLTKIAAGLGADVPFFLTAQAYQAIDKARDTQPQNSEQTEQVVNDFQPVIFALEPEIKKVSDQLMELGCIETLLCGSGSSVAGFVPNGKQEFKKIYRTGLEWCELGKIDGEIYPCRTVNRKYLRLE
jgi:4-diphosphocytidyl-2C-methyl-D-erythritol kinase